MESSPFHGFLPADMQTNNQVVITGNLQGGKRRDFLLISAYNIMLIISVILLAINMKNGDKFRRQINKLQEKARAYKKIRIILYRQKTIISELADISYRFNHDPRVLHRKFIDLINNNIASDDFVNDLCYIYNEFNDGISNVLKDKKLSQTDIYICSLICMGFSNQDICTLCKLNSLNTLYIKKSRIKTKLGLSSKEKIQDFFDKYNTRG